jgi:hypothetical protein
MAKKVKKKNQNDINKELRENRESYAAYNTPGSNKVGLIVCRKCFKPDLYLEMHSIFSDLPDDNGFVNFYISKDENISLEDLFLEFNIPTNLWILLKLVWLNMVFSKLQALQKDTIGSTNKKAMYDLYSSYDFFNEIAKGAIKIESFSIRHSIPAPSGAHGKLINTKQFKGYLSSDLLLKVLKDFFESEKKIGIRRMYEQNRNADWSNLDKRGSKKNNKSQSITQYTKALKKFLKDELFSCDLHPIDQLDEYMLFLEKQKKLFPSRRIDMFIGRMMVLSGLDKEIENELNIVKNDIFLGRQKKR